MLRLQSPSFDPQFQESRSRSEKAILGALGAFRGMLGAALGVRSPILGVASPDWCNAKTRILGATPGAISESDGNPDERFSFAHTLSERFLKNWGGPCAPEENCCRINSETILDANCYITSPICCLLIFLVATTFFPFRGKEEDLSRTKAAFLARF